ncbi:hypothetical protein VP01_13758g1 [Puccinia sorghi]|uniref:Uncharacterized protein n=1 Tax=Puccinia sorghi TaxID=27349 RepID=A0A0L6VNF2_9BASI|nr:hypothetical protein VP01_13758g1 [Puccinia sorghi]
MDLVIFETPYRLMAEKMNDNLHNMEGTLDLEWNYRKIHIKCFCNNIALVVNARLNKLGMEAPPPPKLKKYFLVNLP